MVQSATACSRYRNPGVQWRPRGRRLTDTCGDRICFRVNLAEASTKGAEENRAGADGFAVNLLTIIRKIHTAGATTPRKDHVSPAKG